MSSARSSASGIGPGPGAAGVGARWRTRATLKLRSRSSGALVREVGARDGHGGEHLVEDAVGAHLLGERLVGEDEPVPQRVLHERAEILGEDVVAAANQRE